MFNRLYCGTLLNAANVSGMTDPRPTTVAPRPAAVEIDGAKLRELRQMAGVTLGEFASTCEISVQYLSQIERGDRRRVSPPVYARICRSLKLTGPRQRRTLLKAAA
ncbi:XRE family transcriptional regulator [Verrucosispora sp. SN26_14.1]|uniref:helix-turn-helix domain-containing protein n=1 Tax=Verrucosispora sp. SN26_14.1 TaxID=2527879 RepID=UPI0010DCF91E|nr:helix-turn-helix transcriptional regulator [Verrucosispora sp. SN26_14.1]TBL29074.1 XRE family transcriptional regulator [Verrucosispora sp. SN26_14.1]